MKTVILAMAMMVVGVSAQAASLDTRIGGLAESIAIFKKLNAENLIQAECDSARGARMPFFGVTSRS